ncbi:flagellar hook assembly protein FlgD [Sphingomonas sp. CFBP 13720]|uniref:flagellar hook assembly protein FlgD n=1 Tax=Sphingomonas sp. CFBP 13720 TaxID=2775302 RepID=UPI001786E274|nr:flagellar hook capping FlgD N-terminal domain-containing protein [Sphingomonas sp. CFBP 13720]MBD8679353.1 flagellar hook capping protein [Sphingomonas sp. CFBP 13720]
MQTAPITPVAPGTPASDPVAPDTATSAFGLGFDALLKIILTQLTYQDPLKPMDNFQFVSQLAQFSQVQQVQTTNDRLESLMAVQATNQATGLLGRRVDVAAGAATLSGVVTAVALSGGVATVTIDTDDDRTISGIAIGTIVQVRENN